MSRKIDIEINGLSLEAELNDTQTSKVILNKLPLEGTVNTWGEEIYFEVPVREGLERGKRIVEVGDIAYWPDGSAFCIFFGETPFSDSDGIKPASAVTPLGKVTDDITKLKDVEDGTEIIIREK